MAQARPLAAPRGGLSLAVPGFAASGLAGCLVGCPSLLAGLPADQLSVWLAGRLMSFQASCPTRALGRLGGGPMASWVPERVRVLAALATC